MNGNTLTVSELIQLLPPRAMDANKGDNGKVLIVGGGHTGFSGAVCLAGEAALRVGAGLVSAVVAPESLPLLSRAPSELLCYGFSNPQEMDFLLQNAHVLLLGPGLSQNEWGKRFFEKNISSPKPMVVDADGLNWLAQDFQGKKNNWILTPHPGEAARLLKVSVQTIQENRLQSAKKIQKQYGGIVVLKGANTCIVDNDSQDYIYPHALPVLATPGTGDVLAGLIAGLLAQGLSLIDSAKLGVTLHGECGRYEQEKGVRGMLAHDLFLHLRKLLNVA